MQRVLSIGVLALLFAAIAHDQPPSTALFEVGQRVESFVLVAELEPESAKALEKAKEQLT